MNNIKKIILSMGVVVIFALYSFKLHFGDDRVNRTIVQNPSKEIGNNDRVVSQGNISDLVVPTSTPVSLIVTNMNTSGKNKYKDGSYTGSIEDAFYGNIQVQVVIKSGKIEDVIFLQYPNDRRTSIEINAQAMPILKQEAIAIQNANVDGASGATETSRAFVKSLEKALMLAAI